VKHIAKLLIAILLVCGSIQICAAADLQWGFGGIPWSAALDQVTNCEKVESQGVIEFCKRRDLIHTLKGEIGPRVLYGFYKDAFFAVFIQIDEDEAYDQTKSRLMDLLPTPAKSFDKDGDVSVLRWTQGHIRIELSKDPSSQGFTLAYYYIPLADKALRKQRAKLPSKWPKVKVFSKDMDKDLDRVGILEF